MEEDNQIIIAAGIVSNAEEKILLLKRLDDAKRAPGKWEFPSGKVGYGEEPLAALVRIVQETTGLKVTAAKLVNSRSFVSQMSNKHVVIFYNETELSGESDNVKLSEEYSNAEWVDITELQHYKLEFGTSETLDKHRLLLLSEASINKVNADITTSDRFIIYTDGGSRGNPGPSASGFVIMNEEHEVIEEGGEYIGITTNNQAEYQAVKFALEAVKKYSPSVVDFRIDSMLVVNQMNGVYKIKSKDLWPIHESIKKLSEGIEQVTFKHVYRENNTLADAKVNEILDSRN